MTEVFSELCLAPTTSSLEDSMHRSFAVEEMYRRRGKFSIDYFSAEVGLKEGYDITFIPPAIRKDGTIVESAKFIVRLPSAEFRSL